MVDESCWNAEKWIEIGVSILYNDIREHTAGACPELEDGQPEMDDLNRFFQSRVG